jgi:hypothetical protein
MDDRDTYRLEAGDLDETRSRTQSSMPVACTPKVAAVAAMSTGES